MTSLFNGIRITEQHSPSVKPANVFSFSLFCSRKVLPEIMAQNPVNDWFNKYPLKQVEGIKKVLDLPDWSSFGVVFYIDSDIYQANLVLLDNTRNRYNISIEQIILQELVAKYPNRVVIKTYNFSNEFKYVINTQLFNVDYVGTLVRYLPFKDPEYSIVLIRDAHSTLPSKTKIDAEWRDVWLKSDKKMMMYTGVFYNPGHSFGAKVPFAATFSIRKMHGENEILDRDTFLKYFDLKSIDRDSFFTENIYGIDERVMYRFTKLYQRGTLDFVKDTLLIGISWILYLFHSQTNIRNFETIQKDTHNPLPNTQFEYSNILGNEFMNGKKNLFPTFFNSNIIYVQTDKDVLEEGDKVYDTNDEEIGIVSKKYQPNIYDIFIKDQEKLEIKNINNISSVGATILNSWVRPSENIIFKNFNSNVMPTYNYFEDLRCVVKYILLKLAKKYDNNYNLVTVKEFFDFVEKRQYKASKVKKQNRTIMENFIMMIPSKYHLWEFIFESFIDSPASKPMIKAINYMGEYFSFENLCDINEKYFVGDDFDFDKYYKGKSVPLPKNIDNFPAKHPFNSKIRKDLSIVESSAILSDVSSLAKINFSNSDVLEKINEILSYGNSELGKGGMGTVYETTIQDLIIKVIEICKDRRTVMCLEFNNGNQTITIPPSNKNNIAITILPEYFSEVVISELVSSLLRERKLINFMYTFGSAFDEINGKMFIAAEKINLEQSSKDFLFVAGEDQEIRYIKILKFLLSILCTLYLSQKYALFTHYDLHMGNTLLKTTSEKFNIFIEELNYYISMEPELLDNKIPTIIDYGTSVASMMNENENVRLDIKPKLKNENGKFYNFSPKFDMMTLFLNIFANWQTITLNEKGIDNPTLLGNLKESSTRFVDTLGRESKLELLQEYIELFTNFDDPNDGYIFFVNHVSRWNAVRKNAYKPNIDSLEEPKLNNLHDVIRKICAQLITKNEMSHPLTPVDILSEDMHVFLSTSKKEGVDYFGEEPSDLIAGTRNID